MGLKTILGLDQCPLSEREIMAKIVEAQRKDLRVIEFSIGKRIVEVKLTGVNPKGIMKDYEQRYESN